MLSWRLHKNMGCRSSKNADDDESGAKRNKDPESAEMSQKKRGKKEPLWDTKQERCVNDDDFIDVVMEALRVNFDLLTIDEFKNYISARYLCEAGETYQNEIIHKIIGEQFVKGCLAIKSI